MMWKLIFDEQFKVIWVKSERVENSNDISNLIAEKKYIEDYKLEKIIVEIGSNLEIYLDFLEIAHLVESIPNTNIAVVISANTKKTTKSDFINNYVDCYYEGNAQFFESFGDAL